MQDTTLIGGETAHYFLKLSHRNFKLSSIKQEEREHYRQPVLLLYDEIEMSGNNECSKRVKCCKRQHLLSNNRKNRIQMLIRGDVFQLPPVRSNYILERQSI